MSQIRSRRAGIDPVAAKARPLYARALGLQFIQPSNLMCFMFFEGAIALGVLLALAELADWWAVAILPLSVAIMVKVNDAIAGAAARSGTGSRGSAIGIEHALATGPQALKVHSRKAAADNAIKGLRNGGPAGNGAVGGSAPASGSVSGSAVVSGRASVPADSMLPPPRVDQPDASDEQRARQAASRRYE
jgi:hypothetical protein